MFWLEEGHLELPKGETLTLRYRVIIHSGDAKAADINALFKQYTQQANSPLSEQKTLR
jgi:hypothetical protein